MILFPFRKYLHTSAQTHKHTPIRYDASRSHSRSVITSSSAFLRVNLLQLWMGLILNCSINRLAAQNWQCRGRALDYRLATTVAALSKTTHLQDKNVPSTALKYHKWSILLLPPSLSSLLPLPPTSAPTLHPLPRSLFPRWISKVSRSSEKISRRHGNWNATTPKSEW